MAQKTKLTVRIDNDALDAAKRYAVAHQTSLSALISTFLGNLPAPDVDDARTPILRKLSGILPAEASLDEYHAHLARKYDV